MSKATVGHASSVPEVSSVSGTTPKAKGTLLDTLETAGTLEACPTENTGRPGYRLQRLEVLNWGTFDGPVHTLVLDGQTTLLVGQNGSGKSTLVDALLTLLVRPGRTRNYNLAAGAGKTERSEKSYILGAYDRRSQEDTNRGEIRYLRSSNAKAMTYSVLLACFRNAVTGRVFTLAQVLYLKEGAVEKVYCYAADERSIARDCSGLTGMDKLVSEMKKRGFQATTRYQEYYERFRKATGVKDQAMDMFNQTVAVKDIQRLNDFIRKHMLEAKPWSEKIDELFKHFKDLSDAHRELERVRQQRDLLEPIEVHGLAYRDQAERLQRTTRLLDACDSYFPMRIIELFDPEITSRQSELKETRSRLEQLKTDIADGQDESRRLQNEIEEAGGARLGQIPLFIRNHELEMAGKRTAHKQLADALSDLGIGEPIKNAADFDVMRAGIAPLRDRLVAELVAGERERKSQIEARAEPVRSLRDAEAEYQLLTKRPGNLPPEYVHMRRQMCEELHLNERDLPFAAEMIAVKEEEHDWEGAIEMVLRGLGLSLLVPQRHYALVSRYLDRTSLRDSRGHGQRLVYLQIAERERHADGPRPDAQSLFWKLDFREGWSPLLPWLKTELQERHNIRCCETIEEFQRAHDRAMTKNRHIKHNGSRHEKDDRDRVADPRHFVLGWENQDKKERLAEAIQSLQQTLGQIDGRIAQLEQAAERLRGRVHSVEVAQRFTSFIEIDFVSHEHSIDALRAELRALEDDNDSIGMLKRRHAECEERVAALLQEQYTAVRREQELESQIADGKRIVRNQRQILDRYEADDSLATHAESYGELDRMLMDDPLSLENFALRPDVFRRLRQTEVRRFRDELRPLEDNVVKAMGRYLNANPDERQDLDVSVRYLPDFLQRLRRIRAEDLPRFEDRFKERLNDKVGQEIGILRGLLNTERVEIEDRIQILNLSLRQVPFGHGSHMRLVAKAVRDAEITQFRQELDACVSGQFEGTLTADEVRFKQIESLITRLREEERWRLKVSDVRNWFDFAAVETDDATGAERSYHDDSAGQSGGEKAKLAFTILIAALAFQYDLDPQRPNVDRFHFVVVDEMFSRVDDGNSAYALELFRRFGLQLLIVAPLDAKARVTEDFVGCYLHVAKDERTNRSQVLRMTAREFGDQFPSGEARPRKSR